MELQTENRVNRMNGISRGVVRLGLLLRAKHLVRASKESAEAKREILYDLPGVFSMILRAGRAEIRLIKEADELRIMNRSEKSNPRLIITFNDYAALGDLVGRETTLPKLLSEKRVTYLGAPKYCNVILRVDHEGDKLNLSDEKFAEFYGENK